MVRRFEDTSSPVVARLRPVSSGEFRLSVFHGDCTLLCERLYTPRVRGPGPPLPHVAVHEGGGLDG